jgi:cytidylate kinase
MAILTISREFGSGGREIGHAVAEQLSYEYIDRERILADMRVSGEKWERWGKDLDEHRPTIWEKYDWSFRGFGALIQSHILDYALLDRVVIMGRGGNFLLKDIPHALRVRITAPIDMRIERIAKRESVDTETARWLAKKTDSERASFIHAIYGKRWDDTEDYDMAFDTGVLTVNEITPILKDALLKKDSSNTEEARNALRIRALASRVKAGILTEPHIFVPTLDVECDGRQLILRGTIHSPVEHKAVEDLARKLAPDMQINCRLHYRLQKEKKH